MTNLISIPGIGKSSAQLLEAAGYPDVESLANAAPEDLSDELDRVNQTLNLARLPPTPAKLSQWISSAKAMALPSSEGDIAVTAVEIPDPVNYEDSPQVVPMIAQSPFAIPLPARLLMDRNLAVSDIPPAIFLNRYSGDLEVRIDQRIPKRPSVRTTATSDVTIMAEAVSHRSELDRSRVKTTEDFIGIERSETPTQPVDGRVALIRGPREETNQGRDPQSSFYVRGVLHSHPVAMTFGAITTVLLGVFLPLGIGSSFLLLLSVQMPQHFSWVPKWILAFPLSLPLLGFIFLIWGINGACRICGQKLFVPRMCLKNSRAHYVPLLGYILPVSIHMLVFRWFRCTYCGTPVRLKK